MPPADDLKAVARCDFLGAAPFSDIEGGLFRPYLSPAWRATRAQVARWMEEAGMSTRADAAGNLIGRYEGRVADAPALLIGSHFDSVRDAGRYDGMLGVLLGIDVAAALSARGERLRFPIEVVAFGDEEGSRFPASMLTSRAFAGTLGALPAGLADEDGVALEEALHADGLDPARYPEARRAHGSAFAYLEAHIEQGPVLESLDRPVGIVSAIAAQYRFLVTVEGEAGHAGTVPMALRRDALAAAAECVLAAERIAASGPADLVATVGRMEVRPGVSNVIAGRVSFPLDIRAGTREVRDGAEEAIRTAFGEIAARRGIGLKMALQNDLDATRCDPALTRSLAQAALRVTGEAAPGLVSGAGHDAMIVAALVPVCMLFIRCEKGISHNPAEAVREGDVRTTLDVMLEFVRSLEGGPT